MKSEKALNRYLMVAVFAFLVWQTMSRSISLAYAKTNTATEQSAHQGSAEKNVAYLPQESDTLDPAKPKDRATSVRALVSHLGLGNGSVIADIGAGNGKDTWVFAEIGRS